ncbi:MAG: hypothetical protein ACRD3O_18995 [Terriglobia bacterium]
MDIEKAIQFMLEHQARHDAAIQQHNLAIQQHNLEIQQLRETAKKHDEQIAAVTDLVGRLAQAEIRLVEQMNTTDERLGVLSDRLDAFIVFVEKYIESHGNGHKHE